MTVVFNLFNVIGSCYSKDSIHDPIIIKIFKIIDDYNKYY